MHVPSSLPPISLRSSPTPKISPPSHQKNTHTHTTGTSTTNPKWSYCPCPKSEHSVKYFIETRASDNYETFDFMVLQVGLHLSYLSFRLHSFRGYPRDDRDFTNFTGQMCWYFRCCTDAADGDFPATARPWSFQKSQGPTTETEILIGCKLL